MPLAKNARICILGAGAAGLSAAWKLRKLGYERVTILETLNRPGGKCLSLRHNGVTLELGAALLMPDRGGGGREDRRHVTLHRAPARKWNYRESLSLGFDF